jgi:hypothetical protein
VGSVRWQREQRRKGRPASPKTTGNPQPAAVVVPPGIEADPLAVWQRLAPFAVKAGTLTAGTAEAFALGCRVTALEREVATTNPGGADHRGLLMRVEAFLIRFGLAPMGKPMAQEERPADEWAEFDLGFSVIQGGKKA